MAAIVFQKDKRSGITYAYESVSHWDKEKKQSRAKRKLIGRVDENTGEIVPTDGRNKNRSVQKTVPLVRSVVTKQPAELFYGATYLLDAISTKLGIIQDLQDCFPDSYKQILSMAYYLVLEESPLSRFEKWSTLHKHPHEENISPKMSLDLFASIAEASRNHFFDLQKKRHTEKAYLVYDVVHTPSHTENHLPGSEGLPLAAEFQPTEVHLAIVIGQESNLPLFYQRTAEPVQDTKSAQNLLTGFDVQGYSQSSLVLDRDFYSKDTLKSLIKKHLPFLMPVKTTVSFLKKELDTIYDAFRDEEHFCQTHALYSHTMSISWDNEQDKTAGVMADEEKRIYGHLFYSSSKAREDEGSFDEKLITLRRELEDNNPQSEHEKLYTKYFDCKSSQKRITQIEPRQDAIDQTKRYNGFFSLITSDQMNAIVALDLFRFRSVVMKAIGNADRLNIGWLNDCDVKNSSEQTVNGKLFIQYISLILLAYIKKQLRSSPLQNTHTIGTLLDNLDVITCNVSLDNQIQISDMNQMQQSIYQMLEIPEPTSQADT